MAARRAVVAALVAAAAVAVLRAGRLPEDEGDSPRRATVGAGLRARTTPVVQGGAEARAAWRVLELPGGRVLDEQGGHILRASIAPGSVAKVATLIAALESGSIRPTTTIACQRHIVVAGERLTCTHPEIGRPLTLAEALAHSCNVAFDTVARRLRRDDFDRVLVSLGLAPSDPEVPLAAACLGLRGFRSTPERLLAAFLRVVAPGDSGPRRDEGRAGRRETARRIVLEGLAGAADYGTASVLRTHGLEAYAKTGTASMPGGGQLGIVVAATPRSRPARAIVVVAPGAAGMDAAALAAQRLSLAPGGKEGSLGSPRALFVRLGRTTRGRGEIELLPVEEYVARVVAAESSPRDPRSSREALAITVRTFALANRGRHGREGFDMCDTTHCQVPGAATPASRAAAAATRGAVLLHRGAIAPVFYSASCGGHLERASSVWDGAEDLPYLLARPEPGCRDAPGWRTEVGAGELLRALHAAGLRGEQIRSLVVRARTPSGRVGRIAVEGLEPSEMGGEAFRLAIGRGLGWQVLKSTAFTVSRTAAGYAFEGRGRGHGVGLCVTGAARLARAGRSAADIVQTYFPGVIVGSVNRVEGDRPGAQRGGPVADAANGTGTRVRITLPAGEERERVRVREIVLGAVREYEARWMLPAPSAIGLVFHSTVDAYVRATGRPWWTAAAAAGDRVDLIPPAALRQRGILERTLRHEVAHVMTAGRLAGRPVWVLEGAALVLSGEAPADGPGGSAGPAGGCPSDQEVLRPEAAEALRKAYLRAAACFSAQLAAGREWHQVR